MVLFFFYGESYKKKKKEFIAFFMDNPSLLKSWLNLKYSKSKPALLLFFFFKDKIHLIKVTRGFTNGPDSPIVPLLSFSINYHIINNNYYNILFKHNIYT